MACGSAIHCLVCGDSREYLVVQLINLVEQFLDSGKIVIPSLFHQDPLRRRILFALCMDRIVQHLMRFIHQQNQERIEPVFDPESPIGSTRYMRTWYTTKLCQPTQRSQISHMVADSAWEAHAANVLEASPLVTAYAKNDHLGFQVHYLWNGSKRRYIPDFLIRLSNGRTLILEIKGEKSDLTKAKHAALDAWIQAVNSKGGFGVWCSDIAYEANETHTTSSITSTWTNLFSASVDVIPVVIEKFPPNTSRRRFWITLCS
jgi:type III restriction enzyme